LENNASSAKVDFDTVRNTSFTSDFHMKMLTTEPYKSVINDEFCNFRH
jgi:hypothetical protein